MNSRDFSTTVNYYVPNMNNSNIFYLGLEFIYGSDERTLSINIKNRAVLFNYELYLIIGTSHMK